MNQNVIYVKVPGSTREVLELMKSKKVSGVPVVKGPERILVGIITRENLLSKPDEDQVALLMTREVTSVTAETDLIEAVKTMLTKNIRRLPVISPAGELQGILTIGDVVRKVISKMTSNKLVKDFTQRKVLLTWQETPLPLVYLSMKALGEELAVIVDNHGKPVGVLSLSDFINLADLSLRESKSSLKAGSEGQDWDWDSSTIVYITKGEVSIPSRPCREVMSKPPVTITEFEGVASCAKKMAKHDVDQLVVLSAKNDIVGVIRDIDLLKVLL